MYRFIHSFVDGLFDCMLINLFVLACFFIYFCVACREIRSNDVMNWSTDNSIVTYMPNRTYIFDPETSCDGCDDKNDSFVSVNIPLLVRF